MLNSDTWNRAYAQEMRRTVQDFWKRWTRDYVHHLHQRPKWHQGTRNPQVGELVLLKQENLPPLQWNIGRITATHPGRDGRCRVVDVRTTRGTYRRAAAEVCLLPIETESSKLENPVQHQMQLPTSQREL
uniref:(northern house mosquito) hypothetical protein n=1 Tax=Culex pipiens TaxID=7175 RepID=A0A8D8DMU1_CULPI